MANMAPDVTASGPLPEGTVLDVRNLSIGFRTPRGLLAAVQDVSFHVRAGETLALVGESGSGKSITSLAILRLTPPAPGCEVRGRVRLRTRDEGVLDLLALPDRQMQRLRGAAASMIFQEPMTSFNPVHTIGAQIAEALLFHRRISKRDAEARAVELLDLVGIPDPRRRLGSYPHQLSGGMRQRAMIAMALSCNPQLLIADEPTTALDVTIQAQVLDLLQRLQRQTGMAMIFITHNLGAVAEIADRVMVMYGGRVVEQADVRSLFRDPMMPYTAGLLRSVPQLGPGRRKGELEAIPGNVPHAFDMPSGCAFGPRCSHAVPGRCDAAMPPLDRTADDRAVRCIRWRELSAPPARPHP